MRSKQKRPIIPDQGAKLRYLITHSLDKRPPDPRRPGYVNGEDDLLVVDGNTLASAIGANSSQVSRWVNDKDPFPQRRVPRLCQLFGIDPKVFSVESFDRFREHCEAGQHGEDGGAIDWRTLLRRAPADGGRIHLRDPYDPAEQLRYPTVPQNDFDPLLEKVKAGQLFWVEFNSPPFGGRPLWAARHLLLFNHDLRLQQFRCYLPTLRDHSAFNTATFPETARLFLPREPVMRHATNDIGRFEWVLVTSAAEPPKSIQERLSVPNAHGLAIEGALQELAEWLNVQATHDVSIVRVRYEVTVG